MTLKTVTGPSIAAALADARRLFGDDVVMIQSAPPSLGGAASVTVAFDEVPVARAPRPTPAPAPAPAPVARPDDAVPAPARAYGYAGAARNVRPAPEAPSAWLDAALASAPPPAPPAPTPASAPAPAWVATPAAASPAAPPPAPPVFPAAPEPAGLAQLDAMSARLAELEAALAAVQAMALGEPSAPPAPPALVLVGPSGSGKTSLALRLALRPDTVGASRPAVLVVAPEGRPFMDPTPTFWAEGVPVAVVATADDVREALATFADADLLLVDTPSLPLQAEGARALVGRLGPLLAPLTDLEVHFVVDATRSPWTLPADLAGSFGLRPDALALTRLDEAPDMAEAWRHQFGWPLRLTAAGPAVADLAVAADPSAPVSLSLSPDAAPAASAAPSPAAPVASGDGVAAAGAPYHSLWEADASPAEALTL